MGGERRETTVCKGARDEKCVGGIVNVQMHQYTRTFKMEKRHMLKTSFILLITVDPN